ncbi:MAG: diacylglycerol/lipid kinase family protein [Desulfobaccales bacterium]
MKTVAIVNPVAGYHRAPRIWPRLLEACGGEGSRLTTWWTEGPGHAEILAARARRDGFDRVVAVGGDGTLLEVVNGLWWESQGKQPSLGTVPFGTGCDYVRNFAGGENLEENLASALGEATVPVSLGQARLQGMDGKPRGLVFLNVLGIGFDARVIARFRNQRRRPPGKIGYVLSVLQELPQLSHYRLTGEVNGRHLGMEVTLVAIGLGRYFGGGMMITPGASPASSRFQVVLAQRLSRMALLALVPKIYAGKHLEHPQVAGCFAEHLKLTADPPAYVEGEGELVGRTPLEVEILPRALQFAGQPV